MSATNKWSSENLKGFSFGVLWLLILHQVSVGFIPPLRVLLTYLSDVVTVSCQHISVYRQTAWCTFIVRYKDWTEKGVENTSKNLEKWKIKQFWKYDRKVSKINIKKTKEGKWLHHSALHLPIFMLCYVFPTSISVGITASWGNPSNTLKLILRDLNMFLEKEEVYIFFPNWGLQIRCSNHLNWLL